MALRRWGRLRQLLVIALAVGLLIAAIPVFATRDRPCASAEAPRLGAPVYLALTADPRIKELRCEAHGRVAFEVVRTPAEVDVRLTAEAVAGVVFDRAAYARMRPGDAQRWLATGSGRVVIGLDLTALQLRSGAEGGVPVDPAVPSSCLGDSYYGHLSFTSVAGGGTCGGGGSAPHRGAGRAGLLVERLISWAAEQDACAPR